MLRRLFSLGPQPLIEAITTILVGATGWGFALTTPRPSWAPEQTGWAVTILSAIALLRGVVGAITGIGSSAGRALGGWIRRPQLVIEPIIGEAPFSGRDDAGSVVTEQTAGFLWINVRNRKEEPGSDARDVLGYISVHNESGEKRINVRGSWREVVRLTSGELQNLTEITIGPGLAKQLDAAWKFLDQENAWGLNSEALAAAPATWHDPIFVLPPGLYRVRVRVKGSNTAWSEVRFDLTNPGKGGALTIGRTSHVRSPHPVENAESDIPEPAPDSPAVSAGAEFNDATIRRAKALAEAAANTPPTTANADPEAPLPAEISLSELRAIRPDVAAAFIPSMRPIRLPKRVQGLHGHDRWAWVDRMLSQQRMLMSEGESQKSQLTRHAPSLTEQDGDDWRQRIGRWEMKVRQFEEEWEWGDAERLPLLFDQGEVAVDSTIVPRPEWRARLQGRIDAGLAWLDEIDPPPTGSANGGAGGTRP